MRLFVNDISISGFDFTQKIPAKNLHMTCRGDIEVVGTASRSGRDVFIKAQVLCITIEECHRCLSEFDFHVDAEMDLFFQPKTKGVEATFQDLEADELGVLYYVDNIIELDEAIRDTILIEKPMKILCSENCQGLCVSCGANLNESECSCDPNASKDNPFLEFFNDQKNSNR